MTPSETATEVLGVNDKLQLAELEAAYRKQRSTELMLAGVNLVDPARFDARGPVGCAHTPTTVHARLSDLCANKSDALDPNDLALEAPYRDEPLYWVEALEQTPQGPRSIFVPAQCVFLFCNLDEIKLFSALGSTGLWSGVSIAGAKLSALTEVVERDSEGTTPFAPELCFEIESEDTRLAGLLESYRQNGIHVRFQDITPPMGLPCRPYNYQK